MLYPFLIISIAVTAAVCGFSNIQWPTYLWAVPLMLIGCFAAAILLYIIFLLVVCLFTDIKKERENRSKFYHSLILFTAGLVLKLLRIKVELKGAELIPSDSRWLFVSNHRSMLDAIVAVWALRRHELAFIAKPSVFKIPIAAHLVSQDFYLPIDRENNREALKTILKAAEYIKNDKTSMGIYPEGTRSRDGNMLPFRNGAFKIAQRAKVPVVAATTENSELVTKRFPWRSTTIKIVIHKVFDAETVAASTTADLSDAAQQLMLDYLGK